MDILKKLTRAVLVFLLLGLVMMLCVQTFMGLLKPKLCDVARAIGLRFSSNTRKGEIVSFIQHWLYNVLTTWEQCRAAVPATELLPWQEQTVHSTHLQLIKLYDAIVSTSNYYNPFFVVNNQPLYGTGSVNGAPTTPVNLVLPNTPSISPPQTHAVDFTWHASNLGRAQTVVGVVNPHTASASPARASLTPNHPAHHPPQSTPTVNQPPPNTTSYAHHMPAAPQPTSSSHTSPAPRLHHNTIASSSAAYSPTTQIAARNGLSYPPATSSPGAMPSIPALVPQQAMLAYNLYTPNAQTSPDTTNNPKKRERPAGTPTYLDEIKSTNVRVELIDDPFYSIQTVDPVLWFVTGTGVTTKTFFSAAPPAYSRLILRAAPITKLRHMPSAPVATPQRWPVSLVVSVNQIPVDLAKHRPTEKNKKIHDSVVDITDKCKLNMPIRVDVAITTAAKDKYFFWIQDVNRVTPDTLATQIIRNQHRILSVESSKAEIKRSFADDMVAFHKVTLKDPNTLMRVNLPVRGRRCRHWACFDLTTFLQLNQNIRTWRCPKCDLPLLFHELILDKYFEQALATFPDEDEVILHSDATLAPPSSKANTPAPQVAITSQKPQDKGPVVISLDSDDEEENFEYYDATMEGVLENAEIAADQFGRDQGMLTPEPQAIFAIDDSETSSAPSAPQIPPYSRPSTQPAPSMSRSAQEQPRNGAQPVLPATASYSTSAPSPSQTPAGAPTQPPQRPALLHHVQMFQPISPISPMLATTSNPAAPISPQSNSSATVLTQDPSPAREPTAAASPGAETSATSSPRGSKDDAPQDDEEAEQNAQAEEASPNATIPLDTSLHNGTAAPSTTTLTSTYTPTLPSENGEAANTATAGAAPVPHQKTLKDFLQWAKTDSKRGNRLSTSTSPVPTSIAGAGSREIPICLDSDEE